MRRLLIPLVVVLMVAAAALILVYGPRLMPADEAAPAAGRAGGGRTVPVLLAPVAFDAQRVHIEAVGTSQASQSVILHPAAAGEVVAVHFKPGQRVKAGQLLLELDSRAEKLALELARARRDEARRELARNERLARSNAVSTVTLDAARTAAEVAALEVKQAEVALADRSVRAPFGGHIGLTDVEPGDRIGLDTAIASLDNRDTLLVNFAVPELFLGRLQVGDKLAVAAWTADETRAQGQVAYIDSRVDPERRTFLVRARVSNPEDRLRPGMSFRVSLALEGRRYPMVPEISLQWGDQGSYVWTVAEGRARRIPATIVQRVQGRVLVDAALSEGMAVITEGVQSVREGGPVDVLEGGVAPAGGG